MSVLSKLDLVFCVDLTGSMSGFITVAKRQMAQVLDAFAAKLHGGLRVAIVGYRDHCDGDKLVEVYPLDGNLARVAKAIDKLATSGGGDAPEAVYSGLETCLRLDWATGSYRIIVLVGDAPPHGVGYPGDSFTADPTGLDLDDMANKLEAEGVFVHALAMRSNDAVLASSFKRLSISTGGSYHETSSAASMAIVETIARGLLEDIELDTRLLARLREGVSVPEPQHDDDRVPSRAEILAKLLRVEQRDVHAGLMRLRRRRLLEVSDL